MDFSNFDTKMAAADADVNADADAAENTCSWCTEAPWTFSCATCDPRRDKRLCAACARRWHSRGASAAHVLTSRFGRAQSFEAWAAEAKAHFDASRAASGADSVSQQQSPLQQQEQEQIIADSPDASAGGGGSEEDEEEEEETDKPIPLNELLASLSNSDELPLLDALSEYIHAAVRLEDARACFSFGKCTQPACVRAVAVTLHNESREPPCGDDCRVGLEMHEHMVACKHSGCPFCVRVRLRKELNRIRCIEALVTKQKRAMSHWRQAHKDGVRDAAAAFHFCSSQVKEYERKRLALVEHVEELNALVLRLRLPIFNFPQPAWHIDSEPPIKTESMPSPAKPESTSAAVQPEPPVAIKQSTDRDRKEDEVAPTTPAAELSTPAVDPEDDYIRSLLQTKRDNSQAQTQYAEAMALAFAIAEAAFCSPSKAPRCLLNCQQILTHLQHHLDLDVCADVLCTTVEYHFAHLSICMEEGENDACEYCLRVKERELVRGMDLMSSELQEATVKAQAVVDEITASFENDTQQEHEAAYAQLEDELEQAEEYKRDAAKKLSASRRDLHDLRELMTHLAVPTSAREPLPQHFVKTAKKDSASSKRRKWG